MLKYYLMAIELDNSDAMNNLANYYKEIKDYDNMLKYYIMVAIKLNNSDALNNVASYYEEIKDYDNMKKYYLMAIELNNSDAINYLGNYYKEIKDYDNMKKYLLLGIKNNNIDSYIIIIHYYNIIENNEKLLYKYINEAFNIDSHNFILKLCEIYNKIKVHYLLYKCDITYDIEDNVDFIHFKKQLELKNITKDECIICYIPNSLKIQFKNCIHNTCIDCYINMNKCYYKC
jgi:tetratricopeptide (TPR) repeat protein